VQATTYKVEGIGEDFLPSTLDLSVIDDVIRVTDKESFLWTRSMSAAVRYTRTLDPDRLVVVILPDSGSRYLSKVFDDKWMRENGFLDAEWNESTLREVLETKSDRRLITARRSRCWMRMVLWPAW
jgi:cystathionine beta-synthase